VLSVDIRTNQLIVEPPGGDNWAHIDHYIDRLASHRIHRWLSPEAVSGPTPVELRLANPDVDANLFGLKPADLRLSPSWPRNR
jgi:hypothetical protein